MAIFTIITPKCSNSCRKLAFVQLKSKGKAVILQITISFSGNYLEKSSMPEHSVSIKYSVNIPPLSNVI